MSSSSSSWLRDASASAVLHSSLLFSRLVELFRGSTVSVGPVFICETWRVIDAVVVVEARGFCCCSCIAAAASSSSSSTRDKLSVPWNILLLMFVVVDSPGEFVLVLLLSFVGAAGFSRLSTTKNRVFLRYLLRPTTSISGDDEWNVVASPSPLNSVASPRLSSSVTADSSIVAASTDDDGDDKDNDSFGF